MFKRTACHHPLEGIPITYKGDILDWCQEAQGSNHCWSNLEKYWDFRVFEPLALLEGRNGWLQAPNSVLTKVEIYCTDEYY